MRVVSWNLWWRFGAHWRERQHGITTTLEHLRPDLAGLQEVWGEEGTTQVVVGQASKWGSQCSCRPPPGASVSAERAFLSGDPLDGLHPSDHYAVVVDLT